MPPPFELGRRFAEPSEYLPREYTSLASPTSPHLRCIDPLQTRVVLESKEDGYNPGFIQDLAVLVDRLSQHFEETYDGSAPPPEGFFRKLIPAGELDARQRIYIGELARWYKRDDVVGAFPMNGALPILDQLLQRGISAEKLQPVDARGTEGATTGGAEIKKKLAAAMLDPDKICLFTDDVGDSYVTAIQIALARRLYRIGLSQLPANDPFLDLVNNIRALRNEKRAIKEEGGSATAVEKQRLGNIDDTDLYNAYYRAAILFEEENMVIAPFFDKNKSMRRALEDYTQSVIERGEARARMQASVLRVAVEADENDWIVGGQGEWKYPLFDTAVRGDQLLQKGNGDGSIIDLRYHDKLRAMGFDRLKLRLCAKMPSLWAFDASRFGQLQDYMAGVINGYMQFREEREAAVAAEN